MATGAALGIANAWHRLNDVRACPCCGANASDSAMGDPRCLCSAVIPTVSRR